MLRGLGALAYSNLDLLVAANLAQRVVSANGHVANAHPGCRHDCIFLVCDGCGTTTHLDDDSLTRGLRGRCRDCAAATH